MAEGETDWSTFISHAPSQAVPDLKDLPYGDTPAHIRMPASATATEVPEPISQEPLAAVQLRKQPGENAEGARKRALRKLQLDEDGEPLPLQTVDDRRPTGMAEQRHHGQIRGVGLGLGIDLDEDSDTSSSPSSSSGSGKEGPEVGLDVAARLAKPEGISPPPDTPPLSMTNYPTSSLSLSPDPSIPLHTRLAGRVETFVGRLTKDEKLVQDGRIRRFGPEATLPGELVSVMK